jgi:D-alanyl-D-alanine carboxypeptidase
MAPFRRLTAAGATLVAALSLWGCVREASTGTEDAQGAPPPASLPPPPPDHSVFVAAVDALAGEALQRGPIAGLSIAVFQNGTAVLAKGYGTADLEAGVPATPETSYPIASVSKLFTAALALRLVEQGKVSLDDPLSRFFPDARPQIGALTIRHLLDHTSGLTRGGPAPRDAALSVIRRGGTARSQGETWDYSNYNFSLLGLVIESVHGRDYAAIVRDDLALPLALTGTGYCEDGTSVPGRSRDYLSGRKRVSPTPYWTKAPFFAAGGLCSTVLDLVRWDQALGDGRVVSPAMLRAMRTPTVLPGAIEADYGLGTRMGWTGGWRKVGHTGGGQGNKAVLAHYPDERVTIAVLLNTERERAPVTATDLEERIARLFFAATGAAIRSDAASPVEPRLYTGQYREGSRLVSVADDAGTLTLRSGLQRRPEWHLLAGPGRTFVIQEDPSLELRFHVQDDEARSYTRYRNGWFSGVAVRSGELPPVTAAAPKRQRRSR